MHSQGASFLGPIFEQIGFFEWNGKNKRIEWKLIDSKLTRNDIIKRLKNPDVQKKSVDSTKKSIANDSLLTVDELAQKLKFPKSWVYGRTRESGPDAMPKVHVGKYVRFIWNDVWNWIKKISNYELQLLRSINNPLTKNFNK